MENQTKPSQSAAANKGDSPVKKDEEPIQSDESGRSTGGKTTESTSHSSDSTSGIESKGEQSAIQSSSDELSDSRILESMPPISSDKKSGPRVIEEHLTIDQVIPQTSFDEQSAHQTIGQIKQQITLEEPSGQLIEETKSRTPSSEHLRSDTIDKTILQTLEHEPSKPRDEPSSHSIIPKTLPSTFSEESLGQPTVPDLQVEPASSSEAEKAPPPDKSPKKSRSKSRSPKRSPVRTMKEGIRWVRKSLSPKKSDSDDDNVNLSPKRDSEIKKSRSVSPIKALFGRKSPAPSKQKVYGEEMEPFLLGDELRRLSSSSTGETSPPPTKSPEELSKIRHQKHRSKERSPKRSERSPKEKSMEMDTTCKDKFVPERKYFSKLEENLKLHLKTQTPPTPYEVLETEREARRSREKMKQELLDDSCVRYRYPDMRLTSDETSSPTQTDLDLDSSLSSFQDDAAGAPAADVKPGGRATPMTAHVPPGRRLSETEQVSSKLSECLALKDAEEIASGRAAIPESQQKSKSKERSPKRKEKSPKRKSMVSCEEMDTTHKDDVVPEKKTISKLKKPFKFLSKSHRPVSRYEGMETSESDSKEDEIAVKPKKQHQKTAIEIERDRVRERVYETFDWPSEVLIITKDSVIGSPTQTDLDLDSLSSLAEDSSGAIVNITDAPAGTSEVGLGEPASSKLSEAERGVSSQMFKSVDFEDAEEGTSTRGHSDNKRQMTEGIEKRDIPSPEKQPKYDKDMTKDGGSSYSSESDKEM